jgi:uncharacterized protein (DUF1499 family)
VSRSNIGGLHRQVDIMVVNGTPQVLAAKQATSTTPVVFVAADPVGHPGGNLTGLSLQQTDTATKRLELLREVVPGLRRLAILADVSYWYTRNTVPPIHDITTDLDNPPTFSAVLAARAAERAGSVDNRSPQLAQMQKAAYPDLVSVMTTLPVTRAFNEALDVAKSMPGWTIVASDVDAGRIEASQQSRWFRFTDDIVIRVVGEAGSRIDMRSTSRQGLSDYGVNAARIRAYMSALRERIG